MGRKTLPGGGSPLSIRVSDQLKNQLTVAAEGLGLSEHDTLRLAMQIGFKHFAAIDHDLAATIMAQSGLAPKTDEPKHQPQPVKSGPTAKPTAALPSNITSLQIAAEDQSDTSALPDPKKVNYGSGKPRKKSG